MSNPFVLTSLTSAGTTSVDSFSGNYSDFIAKQLGDVIIGESLMLDTANAQLRNVRMTVQYCSLKNGYKFATKSNSSGLWVRRIS